MISKLATPPATPLCEASSFKANPLVTSAVLAFKLILLLKVAVSAFCNKKLVSVLLNFKANPLVTSVVFAFKLIRLDIVAVSAFLNSTLVSVIFNFKFIRLDKVAVSALFNFVPS